MIKSAKKSKKYLEETASLGCTTALIEYLKFEL
jgi:hypothetical protein